MTSYSKGKKSKSLFDGSTARYLSKDSTEMDFSILNSAKVEGKETREDVKMNNIRFQDTKIIKKLLPGVRKDIDKNLNVASDHTGVLDKFEDLNYAINNRYYMLYDHENIEDSDYTFSSYSFLDAKTDKPFNSTVTYEPVDDSIDVAKKLSRQLNSYNKRLVRSSLSVIKD